MKLFLSAEKGWLSIDNQGLMFEILNWQFLWFTIVKSKNSVNAVFTRAVHSASNPYSCTLMDYVPRGLI